MDELVYNHKEILK